MKRRLGIAVASAVMALVHATDVAAVVVDDFSSATTNSVAGAANGCLFGAGAGTCFVKDLNVAQPTVGSTTVIDASLPDVLGGSRQLTVVAESLQSITPPDIVVAGVVPLASFLEYDSTTQADGRIELLYDRNGQGLGLSLSQFRGIRVVILDADDASVTCLDPPMGCTPGYDVTATLRDDAAHSASLTQTVVFPGGPVTLTFPLSGFPALVGSNIFSIEVGIDPNTAGDMRIDRIEALGSTSAPLLSLGSVLVLMAALTLLGLRLLARRGLIRS